MAENISNRKAFDIPVLDDIDEIIPVTPLFTRITRTKNTEESKANISESENVQTVLKLPAKQSNQKERITAPCSGQNEMAPATKLPAIDGEARKSNNSEVCEKTVSKICLETAFVENTKHETRQVKPSTSNNGNMQSSQTL